MSAQPKARPETGIVNIHGRDYQTVALRIRIFREHHPDWCVACEVVERNLECVVMRCVISDDAGRTIATGYAEEFRKASSINRTSALENCETSAIGRALAAAGYGGTEFASANEVQNAIEEKPSVPDADVIVAEWMESIDSADSPESLDAIGKGIAQSSLPKASKIKLRAAYGARMHAFQQVAA